MSQTRKSRSGFTLIEVMVALGIVAIALMAGLQASSALTRNAQRETDVMLAQLCAENEQVRIRLARQMMGLGTGTRVCEQAGRTFQIVVKVQVTPNPNFQRVDVQVLNEDIPVLQLSSVVGII